MKRDAPKAWDNESLHHHYLRGRWQQHGPGCGIVQRLPQETQSPSESARADQREGYHRLL